MLNLMSGRNDDNQILAPGQLKWRNLRDGRCPKCDAKLNMGLLDALYSCTGECDFSISREKFDVIAFGPSRKSFQEMDNLAALNNLGHELVAEDFSDSPHKT